jgi:hypothetical protein
VTGGGRGIGAAVARLAACRGYAVAVNYIADQKAASSVVRDIERNNARASAIQADVSKEKEVVQMFEMAERNLGPVVALVNNAGITGGFSRLEALEVGTLERVLGRKRCGSNAPGAKQYGGCRNGIAAKVGRSLTSPPARRNWGSEGMDPLRHDEGRDRYADDWPGSRDGK